MKSLRIDVVMSWEYGLIILLIGISLIIFGVKQGKKKKKDVISEAADTLYHMCVLLRSKSISINEVLSELASREGISGIEEKRKRNLK